jgi:hypothetical protein
MKKPSKSPHVSPQTPLASGMGFASTAAADLLVLLQNQTQYIQSLEKEKRTFKITRNRKRTSETRLAASSTHALWH